jgi:hypothetical protein
MAAINRYPHVPGRNARICARYDESRAEKLSFEDLGREFGLSRETVRKVIGDRDRDLFRAERLAAKLRPLREAFAKGIGRQVQ